MVIEARSVWESVTRRKRSDCAPTRPSAHDEAPADETVSTRIGSLKSGPRRVCPIRNGADILMAVPWATDSSPGRESKASCPETIYFRWRILPDRVPPANVRSDPRSIVSGPAGGGVSRWGVRDPGHFPLRFPVAPLPFPRSLCFAAGRSPLGEQRVLTVAADRLPPMANAGCRRSSQRGAGGPGFRRSVVLQCLLSSGVRANPIVDAHVVLEGIAEDWSRRRPRLVSHTMLIRRDKLE
jgi:hypothetical protein